MSDAVQAPPRRRGAGMERSRGDRPILSDCFAAFPELPAEPAA